MFPVSVGGTIHNANLTVDVVKPVSFLEELSMVLDYFNILLESEFVSSVLLTNQLFLPIQRRSFPHPSSLLFGNDFSNPFCIRSLVP